MSAWFASGVMVLEFDGPQRGLEVELWVSLVGGGTTSWTWRLSQTGGVLGSGVGWTA